MERIKKKEEKKEEKQEEKTEKITLKKRFSAKRLALMAVFVALAFGMSFLEIPTPFFGANFLKLDFGNVFIVLISFLLGPIEGVIVCVLKECLRMIGGTVVGEIANMIMTCSFLLLPSIVYRYKKGIATVVWSLAAACVIATGAALVVNRFITFPLYEAFLGMPAKEAFGVFWGAILIFNLLKTAAISVLTMLLYKRLSNFLKNKKI